jgi:histidyl-tRNA synthetase
MPKRKQFRAIQAIKGVRDILPPETALWNWFEQTARGVMESYGFREIRLPIFEETELFARSVGADTDIVSKEMYTFQDRDETAVTLRPEATASVVRAYIEHGMHTWPQPVKLYYLGPMFRRERPQKGRYRQFYQIGAEVLGPSDHPAIDAELIEMLAVLLERCRIERWTLFINSIGCKECRPPYVERLREELRKVKAKLGPDSQHRIETNPLRVLDSKLPEEQAIIEKLPRITEHLCAACREHFAAVQEQLKLRGIPYEVNWRLVRGLDYYMRTTFEITSPALGAQNALVGGGRYDGLSELLGGPPAKGIGFALGEDRFVLAMQEAKKVDASRPVDVFLAWIGVAAYPAVVQLARRLRAESLAVELPAEEMKLKKSLGLADKLGARYAVLLGENELASGQLILRRLADGEQKMLTEAELVEHLKSERGRS